MLRRGDVSRRLGPPVSECGKKQRGTPRSPRDNNIPRKQPPPSPGRGTRKQGRGHQIRMQRSLRSRCQGKGQREQDKSRGPPGPDGRPGRRPVSSEPPLHTGVYHLTGNTHSPRTGSQASASACRRKGPCTRCTDAPTAAPQQPRQGAQHPECRRSLGAGRGQGCPVPWRRPVLADNSHERPG